MYYKETILDASNYSDKIVQILEDQKEKYDVLKNTKISNNLFGHITDGKLYLPVGTLVHGTSFDKEKLLKIKEEGILSSEFASNKPEKYDETYYMADFFKNASGKSMTIPEFLNCQSKNIGLLQFLPLTEKHSTGSYVSFIVNTENEKVKKYLERDLFSDNNTELFEFISEEFCYSLGRRKHMPQYDFKLGQCSIPLGMPYSAISGIIVDKMMEEERKDELDFIKETFGQDLLILSTSGKILSQPKEYDLSL